MNIDAFLDLVRAWEERAEGFLRIGIEQPAAMVRVMAGELRAAVDLWRMEALTLEQAVIESGYSYSTLQQRLASGGDLPNAGDRRAPRIRRCDLPRKGGVRRPTLEVLGPDVASEVLSRRTG